MRFCTSRKEAALSFPFCSPSIPKVVSFLFPRRSHRNKKQSKLSNPRLFQANRWSEGHPTRPDRTHRHLTDRICASSNFRYFCICRLNGAECSSEAAQAAWKCVYLHKKQATSEGGHDFGPTPQFSTSVTRLLTLGVSKHEQHSNSWLGRQRTWIAKGKKSVFTLYLCYAKPCLY